MNSSANWAGKPALALLCAFFVGGFTTSSIAAEEVIMRQTMDFRACKQAMIALPTRLSAKPEQVTTEVDTAALFTLKVASTDANLILSCNKVADQVEIKRSTPGDWTDEALEATAALQAK